MEAVVNRLGGMDGVRKLLRGKLKITELGFPWTNRAGVIYFSVTSGGTTGSQWVERLKKKELKVDDEAESVLRSPDFKPTLGIVTEVAVLTPGLFTDKNRTTNNIIAEATRRGLMSPHQEVACLILDALTPREIVEMGFWRIVVMHKPYIHPPEDHLTNDPRLLCVDMDSGFNNFGLTGYVDVDVDTGIWNPSYGFAFMKSQVGRRTASN
jgi:hypothetical protein